MINIHDYSDIINIKRPDIKHQRMTLENRAAQFSPFRALTGYEDSIDEEGRIVDRKIELSDEDKESLRQKLNEVNSYINPNVKIIHFVPDLKKEGGVYNTTIGIVKRIDEIEGKIIFLDKSLIYLDNVLEIEIIK